MKELSIRLDKLIADNGSGTRKDVKTYVCKGLVTVNGVSIKRADTKVRKNDIVIVNGETIVVENYIYLLMNKPKGYICATEDYKAETVMELIPSNLWKKGLFPVGRLDKDTTGMLVITNDGDFSHQILSPRNLIPKTYIATLDIPVTKGMIKGFASGIQLKAEKQCKPAGLEVIDEYTCKVVIMEGMYHQIKRMFGCYGAKIVELERVGMGDLSMDKELEIGEVRKMEESELELIHKCGHVAQEEKA